MIIFISSGISNNRLAIPQTSSLKHWCVSFRSLAVFRKRRVSSHPLPLTGCNSSMKRWCRWPDPWILGMFFFFSKRRKPWKNHGKWSLICWLCNVVYPICLGPYWLPLNYSIIQLLLIPIFCYRSHCYTLFTNPSQHQTYCLMISNELWSKLALFFEDSPGTSRWVEASESQAEHDKMLRKVRAEGSMVKRTSENTCSEWAAVCWLYGYLWVLGNAYSDLQ